MAKCNVLWFIVNFVLLWNIAMGQEEEVSCYGSGAIALSVVLTLIAGVVLAVLMYVLWNKFWKSRKGKHLILETDPEKGKGEYAFDNPGFKDAGLTPVGKTLEKSKVDGSNNKNKWNQWSPLGVLTTKNEKKRTQDDTILEDQVKIVPLKSHDFTGLGFNICGNMKDGIFIKDVLHRGPASESGKLNAGDRIHSVTISFEHMVYEDALNILSYASPYEVILAAQSSKAINFPNQSGKPGHPIFRSSSTMELTDVGKTSKKRLFQPDESSDLGSNYSSLQKNRSTNTTLERSASKSPKPAQKPIKPKTRLSPEQLKSQLEQNIMQDYKETMRMKNDLELPLKVESESQRTDKYQKFGVQVFPMENKEQRSPKSAEHSQNDNNINLEKTDVVIPILSIDEVDKKVAPPIKKREKLNKEPFDRNNALNDSGIKRDENNIPLEMPNNMYNAALAARKNRKSMEEEDIKSPKKLKGKAPAPPPEPSEKLDEISPAEDAEKLIRTCTILNKSDDSIEKMQPDISTNLKSELKDYASDSDIETDNQSSVNTIELNASDITIHQSEENEEKQNRKTASTGDLTKIHKTRKTSTGTLERAQSLDITDTTMPTLAKKRKAGKIEDSFDSKTSSDESLYGNALINKEPRLSLILDGLNTFQRSRLKKSTEWGNLEDAILNVDKQDSVESLGKQSTGYEDFKLSAENFNFGAKSPEFDALVNKINEIKQETIEIINEQDRNVNEPEITKEEITEIIDDVPKTMQTMSKTIEDMPTSIECMEVVKEPEIKNKVKNQIWPVEVTEKRHENGIKEMRPKEVIDVWRVEKVESKPVEIAKPYVEEERMKPVISMTSQKIDINKPTIRDKIAKPEIQVNLSDVRDFIQAEREASNKFFSDLPAKLEGTNISDDIKVSLGSLERPKYIQNNNENVSNITISEVEISNKNEVKPFVIEKKEEKKNFDNVIVSTPDLIKNITIAEAIHDLNNEVTVEGPTSLTFEIPGNMEIVENKLNGVKTNGDINKLEVQGEPEKSNSSLTYITEIQVLTPNNKGKNISEIEIIPKLENSNLDNDFETYIKNFESNIKNFENNIHSFEQNIQDVVQTVQKEPVSTKSSITINEKVDAEKELLKVQEIVEEQLKKLPEMRFTTSSYESQIKPPEKRQSQIEILRSNFEKSTSPPRMARSEISPPKSRIPVLNKTPPTSPERRDSRNLETEPDKEILEMMSSHIPMKYQPKTSARNVTVTSIRSNSKIPSGLPTYSSRPPVPPRKIENDDHTVQISTNGNMESSFRQWVFNPADSITNITVTESKYDHK